MDRQPTFHHFLANASIGHATPTSFYYQIQPRPTQGTNLLPRIPHPLPPKPSNLPASNDNTTSRHSSSVSGGINQATTSRQPSMTLHHSSNTNTGTRSLECTSQSEQDQVQQLADRATEELLLIDIYTLSPIIGWKCVRRYDHWTGRQRIEVGGVSGTSVQISSLQSGLLGEHMDNMVLEVWKRFRPCGRIDGIHVPTLQLGQEWFRLVLDFEDQASVARALAMYETYTYEGQTIQMSVDLRLHSPQRSWIRIRPIDFERMWEERQSRWEPPKSQVIAQMFESNNFFLNNFNGFMSYPAIAKNENLPAVSMDEMCAPLHTLSVGRLPPVFTFDNDPEIPAQVQDEHEHQHEYGYGQDGEESGIITDLQEQELMPEYNDYLPSSE
ncbi:hypothetical protein IAT40_006795 [Kwoniella sp. CBS 6097]